MPQTYNLGLFIVFIVVINCTTGKRSNKIKGVFRIGPHNIDVLSIITGSLLGDAHAEKRAAGVGTRISFYQEHSHLKYIYYLHGILSAAGYCEEKIPLAKHRLGMKGKVRRVLRFHTWTYTSFNWIKELWYADNRKRVPDNISQYLTPLALAVWIMDDGCKVNDSIKFSTNSFTYKECMCLTNALYNNFNLKASVQSAGAENQFVVYVWKQSMDHLRSIVQPYIIPEMKYKLI